MLSNLLSMKKADLKARLQSLNVESVKGRSLRRRFERIRNKEGGFTLLELLVVVAILAAIAGTATIMLQDTDRKGAAAAHVAMMDELSKGIQTYRVLNNGQYPDVWDSLMASADGTLTAAAPLALLSADLTPNLNFTTTLSASELDALTGVGVTRVRVVNAGATIHNSYTGTATCANNASATGIVELVRDKGNDIVPGNIFRAPGTAGANGGCGGTAHVTLASGDLVATWAGDAARVGVPQISATAGANLPANANKLVAFGIGPDSTLFEPTKIGALSNVPVYRHVTSEEYNRFIVLFNVSPTIEVTPGVHRSAGGQATFQAIIDGAGDTKDEELGEVDNIRAT